MLEGTQTQDDHGLDAWREQVERAWNLRGDYLESLFFYYGENVRVAEKATAEG
jgi:hypothetical protein